jgi:hypothetical protein
MLNLKVLHLFSYFFVLHAHALHQKDWTGHLILNTSSTAQVILGIGFEIQSDSIGSGNEGMPDYSNTSVPYDLIPSEKTRFFQEMITGFRFCRLALGLYFRGTTPDKLNMIERFPGQAAGLAEMATVTGLEGFEVEYWSPTPGWKKNNAYINGKLRAFDATTLQSFAKAVATDALYLKSMGINPVWWGLQNEPPVGTNNDCIYSCCWYNASEYYLAFKATATAIRQALPDTIIHASSWSGQDYAPMITRDPEALGLVDAWTFHRVGANSDEQLKNPTMFLNNSFGRPELNNEFEYLDMQTNAERTINTAQSIMNWMVFENAPSWYWLHALKPLTNSEAKGYSLGFWAPTNRSVGNFSIPPGTWEYNYPNFNAVAGFTKYLPWNSIRINVSEDMIRPDFRVLAYLYDPKMARWKQPRGSPNPSPSESARSSLLDGSRAQSAASKIGFVVTHRLNATVAPNFTFLVDIINVPTNSPPPTFSGHLYSANETDISLGTKVATRDPTTGVLSLSVTLTPETIQFWVEE